MMLPGWQNWDSGREVHFPAILPESAEITASSEDAAHPVENALTDTRTTWYQPKTDAKTGVSPAELIFDLHTQKALKLSAY